MSSRKHQKTAQLCRQAEQALSSALFSSANPVLRDITIVAVTPICGASLLRVVVSSDTENAKDDVLSALGNATGYLRSQLADAISRKRVPNLSFELALLPQRAGRGDDALASDGDVGAADPKSE